MLARIQVAMEAVEEYSFGTSYVSNMIRSTITTGQVPTQGQSPQAEELRWEFQLRQDRSAILLHIAAATMRALSSELLGRQKDGDYTCHLGKRKPSTNRASTAVPLPVQAPVELLAGTHQVTDTTSTGLSGKREWQKEPAPPENNVEETDGRSPKGSKVAAPLQDHRSSEDTNLRSRHSETTFKSGMPTVDPVFRNHFSTPLAAGKTEERAPSLERLE